jgi:hypothetical protein
MDPSAHISISQSPKTAQEFAAVKEKPYCEAVSLLMYASLSTRPDITYAVSILSKFTDNPGLVHWNTVKHILAYLAGTKDLWLTNGNSLGKLRDTQMLMDRCMKTGKPYLGTLSCWMVVQCCGA